ncbi:molybdopterin-dependent oxidoreductase, partial [Methylophaga sp. UBA3996]
LSGNIIDLCPVGALTSKPFRYKARAWEMKAHPSIAPHDAIGSNIELHVRQNDVMRVVPRDNESINEAWLSDRDRFSYQGLAHPKRLSEPMIKVEGDWQVVDWQTALETAVKGLQTVINKHGAEEVGGMISPTATLEEAFLFQKWLRGLGVENIDHRLRQQDFSDSPEQYATESWTLADVQDSDAIVLIGSHVRAEQPILAHRIRQAAINGAVISNINFFLTDLLMPVEFEMAVDIKGMLSTLAGIAKVLSSMTNDDDDAWHALYPERTPTAFEQNVAMQLSNAATATLIVGDLANHHPDAAKIRALVQKIAELSGSRCMVMPSANSQAHVFANTLPGKEAKNSLQMWQQ